MINASKANPLLSIRNKEALPITSIERWEANLTSISAQKQAEARRRVTHRKPQNIFNTFQHSNLPLPLLVL
jgi:hypothetical protein